jgi:hypothetical protein
VKPDSPWGVSEKLPESCKGNFADAGSGSMGMRRDELANSSTSREEEEEGKEDKTNFKIPSNGGKDLRPEGREATFFGFAKAQPSGNRYLYKPQPTSREIPFP